MKILEIFQDLNFANPEVLYGLLLLPLILFICHINLDSTTRNSLKNNFHKSAIKLLYIPKNNLVLITLMRALFFSLLLIAIAGPRWSYHDIETKTNITNNLLLLDVSKSMNAIDLKPNRFEHAKRKIDQIINESGNFGLVAFAKTSYNLIPFTSDKEYIKNYLRNLQLTNFSNEGSNFNFSLDLILKIHKATPLNNVYIISDFDFSEPANQEQLQQISKLNIQLIPIQTATNKGSPIEDTKGRFLQYNGGIVISKPMIELVELLNKFTQDQNNLNKESVLKKNRVWHEEYYLFLMPLLILFLFLNKRSAFLSVVFVIMIDVNVSNSYANPLLNNNQNAKNKYDQESYEEAYELFNDDYNKAVSAYRLGDYESAVKYFKNNETQKSQFNLANSLLMNEQIDDAISQYEKILKQDPNHEKSKKNLEIAKQIQRQNQKSKNDKNDESKNDKENDDDQESKNNEDQDSDNKTKVTPKIKKQNDNYAADINKIKDQNLNKQIEKAKTLQSQHINNPW